ncbi:MAG: MFS transporter [Candidatus Symbiothrix sp.]|jgi:inositol transporter-like SP family MFS transporter|nr:MFS transporter [Candidatus Symbiothrix sp.]
MKNQKSSLKSTIAVSLTNYLDAGAIVAGASGLTLWQNYLGLSGGHLGWLNALSANCFGAAIGAIIGGRMADKYGRKTIYTYNMLLYMLGVLVVIFASSFPMLLAGFLITGISVGVGVPASWTYISETSEVGNRGRNIGISQLAWSIGPALIFLLGWLVSGPLEKQVNAFGTALGISEPTALAVFGNRLIFVTLFIVALIAWLLQRRLDESAEWEISKKAEKTQPKQQHPYKALFTNKINVKSILFLVGIYLTWNFVAGAMGFFMPHVYETAGGLTNDHANFLQMFMWGLTALFSFAGFAMLADKVNQRFLYAFGTILGVAAWVVLTFVGIKSQTALWAFVVLWGIHAGFGVQAFYALWASELFPARYRAAAQGVMFFLVRGLSAVWSFVFVYIYAEGARFELAGKVLVALLLVSLVVGVIWTPKTRGKSLKEIEAMISGSD